MVTLDPKCFKCGASSAKFCVKKKTLSGSLLIILYCEDCGVVQGVTRD